MNHDINITCKDCPYLVSGLDGNSKSIFCCHPARPWQDICRYDGYPLFDENLTPYFDVSKRCWSECPFKQNLTLWRYYNIGTEVAVLAHNHEEFTHYNSLSLPYYDSHIPPMLTSGILVGGPFKDLPFVAHFS
jgi:hypothetical protein